MKKRRVNKREEALPEQKKARPDRNRLSENRRMPMGSKERADILLLFGMEIFVHSAVRTSQMALAASSSSEPSATTDRTLPR